MQKRRDHNQFPQPGKDRNFGAAARLIFVSQQILIAADNTTTTGDGRVHLTNSSINLDQFHVFALRKRITACNSQLAGLSLVKSHFKDKYAHASVKIDKIVP